MNVVTVKINGVEYNLKGEENEEYLHKVAAYVDKKLKNIMSNNRKLSTSSAAVLTAVNAIDDLFKCDRAYSEMLSEVEKLEGNEKKLVEKIDLLQQQLQHLENHNKELLNKLEADGSEKVMNEKDEEIRRFNRELEMLQESSRKFMNENSGMKAEIKDLKFQLQSSKYKIIDLQNRLIENQIDLAKVKRNGNALLKTER